MENGSAFDVVVVGAGIAGLTCAQRLQQAGYRVVVIEKSRGVGGRMATRRLHGTFADHGTCYLSPKNSEFQALVNHLVDRGILNLWLDAVYEMGSDGVEPIVGNHAPRYAAPQGMTAIAKFLATQLNIQLNQRAIQLALIDHQYWKLTAELTQPEAAEGTIDYLAKSVVIAIPAPQAVLLLRSLTGTVLTSEFINRLEAVKFLPCLSAIAGYPASVHSDWETRYPRAIAFSDDPDLAWIGLDSSKRQAPAQPVFVVQSTAAFAECYLEAIDLQPAGDRLLQRAAQRLAPWLASPEWLQIHRWRYAFPQTPLPAPYLSAATPLPLLCTGDWCGGMRVETAFAAGLAAAEAINLPLQNLPLGDAPVWAAIAKTP